MELLIRRLESFLQDENELLWKKLLQYC
jgi:hypothetical protein